MDNKLGINHSNFMSIEKEIVNVKLRIIDEFVTFNLTNLGFEYLKEINNFLFSDIYGSDEIGIRDLSKEEIVNINNYFNTIEKICLTTKDVKKVLKIIENLWYLQIFNIGNTRTLMAYLKVLNSAFLLDLDIDLNKNIESKPTMFNINNFVNQKRLTKTK